MESLARLPQIQRRLRQRYVYRRDASVGRDASRVYRTRDFDLPLRRNRQGGYKLASGSLVYTCFTSDFLVEEADAWRQEAFAMMRQRQDLRFFFITKRIERLGALLPEDWGPEGYANVEIGCTCEDQEAVRRRLPGVFAPAHPSAQRDLRALAGPRGAGGLPGRGRRGPGGGWGRIRRGGQDLRLCLGAVPAGPVRPQRRRLPLQANGRALPQGRRLYAIPRRHQLSQARKAGIDL